MKSLLACLALFFFQMIYVLSSNKLVKSKTLFYIKLIATLLLELYYAKLFVVEFHLL